MRPYRRGLVLISILFMTLLTMFFLGALVQMNPTRLKRTLHDENRDRATQAARAGVEYALNRFHEDLDWDGTGNSEIIRMDDLVVREDEGNVLGWVKNEQGQWAGFRFRFNHQDGQSASTSGSDGYDKDPIYPISSSAISLNNLSSDHSRPLPLGDGANFNPTGNFGLDVPAGALGLVVEGIVGPNLHPDKVESLCKADSGISRTLEGLYVTVSVTEGTAEPAVVNTETLTAEVKDNFQLSGASDNIARIRAKDDFKLVSGTLVADKTAELLVSNLNAQNHPLEGSIQIMEEDEKDPFVNISWDKVSDSSQAAPYQIPSGVYIFSDGDQDSGRTKTGNSRSVHYYDMTWEQYRQGKIDGTLPPAQEPSPDFLSRVSLDAVAVTEGDGTLSRRDQIIFDKDVDVLGDKGLAIIPERGARQKAGSDGVAGDPPDSVPPANSPQAAENALEGGIIGQMFDVFHEHGGLGAISIQGIPGTLTGTASFVHNGPSSGALAFHNFLAPGNVSFEVPNNGVDLAHFQQAMPYATFEPSSNITLMRVTVNSAGGALNVPGEAAATDPLHIPNVDPETTAEIPALDGGSPDQTVPQDIEIKFTPVGEGTAKIRTNSKTNGNIFLGTHITGEGGVVASGKLDLVGFGVTIQADQGERDGIALYAEKTVNISTYDERRNKYWDVNIFGSIFTREHLNLRLGEDPLTNGEPDPTWGQFHYEGSIVTLGLAASVEGIPVTGFSGGHFDEFQAGKMDLIAQDAKLVYDPRYLAPYLEDDQLVPSFAPLSVNLK